jgi:UDP-N-acetylmuramoyl-tripeptide--D-alanyl-D-alanine ligase
MALAAGLDRLSAVGPLSLAAVEAFGRGAEWFEDRASLLAALEREVSSDDVVLVKGSRSAGMEVVAQALAGGGGG